MLLDAYMVEVTVPGNGHFLDEELDEKVAKLAGLKDAIEEAVADWVRERVPDAEVEVS